MSWLKDRWEEVTAQVKMGDNRTASTVRAARAKAAPATTRVNTNQPGWSVRKPQQSLTTQQRIDQSYGGGFSGIKNRVIDTFDANTEADRIKRFARTGLNESYEQQDARLRKQRIESELKASEAKRDAGGYSNYAPTKAANTVMSGAIRSIHGIGQGMGGLVDLVTPGKGTNRLTDFTKDYGEVWDKKREHAGVNKTAYQLAQLPMTLYGYSVGDKAITGTAQLAAKGISAIPKVGAIVPKVAGAVDTISKSKPMVSAATKLDDLALNGTRAQRVGAKLAQSYAKPGTMGNITALNTLQNAGERSSRGQDNNWGTFATDIATGLAMQGGLNLAGQAGAGVVRGVSNRITEPTTNLVQRGKSELATGLNTLNRGANQHTPYTQLVPTESGRQIVSPRDSGRVIRENLDEISEKTRARIQAAREKVPERFKLNKYGGSNADFDSPTIRNDLTGEVIPNPAYRGKNVDPLESLKQEADTGKVFYHGTSNKDLKSLTDLQAGSGVGKSGRNRVYVTENPEIAKNFGDNVIEQRLYGKHLNVKDIGVEKTPGWAQDNVVAPEFADYKTTKLLTERERRVFENQFVRGVPNNTIIEDTPGIHKYLASKGYTTITVPRTISDVDGVRSETIIIDKKAFQAPVQPQPPKSTPKTVEAKPPTPFEQNLQTAGLAPNTPQRQVVRNTAPAALDSQGYNPNQSQSASNSQPPQTSPVVRSSETQQQAPLQGKTGNTQVTQNSQSLTSSDNIIDLKTIDVNDPFKNNSLAQKFRNEFGKYFIDEDTEMINLLKRIEKETKSKDLVEQWLQDTDLVRASNSIANSKLRNNQNLSNALNGMSKKDMADFDRYAAARSELSNVQRGLTSTSKTVAELQKTVDDLGGKFSKRFDSLNSFYNDLSNDLFEAGIIDATTRDKWAQNKDYVRVQRDMEDLLAPQVGRGRSRSFGTTSTSKKRTGSQREILSSTQSALKRAQEIQLEIQRNKAANNIIDVLEKYGLAEQIPSTQTTNKNVIKRFKDGKVQNFETSKDVKRVIDSVNPIQLGVIAKVISAPTRLFRAGTTALSAPFAVTNYARDQLSSGVFSKDIKATHNPKSVVSGLYGALKDFGGVQNDPLWKKFEQIAGDQTIFDELRNAKNSKKLLTEIRRGGGFKARGAELINPLNTVRNLEDLIGVTEKSTRFQNFKGIYEKAKRQGVSEDVAIRKATQAALQNSVNFSRAGQVTRIANLMFPYFNAGIQGSRNVGRSLRDRPVATTAKAVTLIGIPSIAAVLYNYEDEERKKIYENIPETEKENGFVFVLPGAKQREDGTYEGLIKIPKPQGYRELTDPIRVVAERFAGAEDSKSVAEMMKDMIPAFSGPLQTSDMNKFTSTFVPQMVKPALQAHLNKDLYWGSDTVPEYMVEGTDDATKRAYKSTSGMARFIADQLKVSPIQVEKAIIDTTGALGRYGVNAVDTALAKAGKIPEEQIGGRSIKSDFSRRMFEARGIEKEEQNMTPGQKYFKAVKTATANMKPQEKVAWDSYNQSNKNFLGEVIYDKNSQAKKQAKAAAYIDHPGLFQTDKKIDAEARKRGEPGNPLYDLTYQQALMVVQQKALPPGAKDEGLNTLYDQAWYQKFKNDEDKFYEQIFAGKEDAQDNPYPTRSPELTKAMDYYYNLPSSYAKSQFKKANPGIAGQMEAYAESKRNWTNTERAKIGLPPIVEDAKYAKSGGSGGKRGGRGSKGGSKYDYTKNLFASSSDSASTSKQLRAILEKAMSGKS